MFFLVNAWLNQHLLFISQRVSVWEKACKIAKCICYHVQNGISSRKTNDHNNPPHFSYQILVKLSIINGAILDKRVYYANVIYCTLYGYVVKRQHNLLISFETLNILPLFGWNAFETLLIPCVSKLWRITYWMYNLLLILKWDSHWFITHHR